MTRRPAAWTLGIFAVIVGFASLVWALPLEDIDHFLRVDAQVCTGGQPSEADLARLAGEGIRTVIDLRERSEHDVDAEAAAAHRLGLGFFSIPVKAADPKDEDAKAFLEATASPEVFPAFIHCGSGNRVGAFWMIRRVLVDGWTVEKAEEEARRIGLHSPNLVDFSRDYIQRHARRD